MNQTIKTKIKPETLHPDYEYIGDINIEHGGTFFKMDTYQDGYVNAVRIIDLDGGCGFAGGLLIEKITILGVDDPDRVEKALECCGYQELVSEILITESLMCYGYYDPDYGNYREPHNIIIQTDPGNDMAFNGWVARKVIKPKDLLGYIESKWLD